MSIHTYFNKVKPSIAVKEISLTLRALTKYKTLNLENTEKTNVKKRYMIN